MTHLLDDCWLLVDRAQRQFDALRLEVIQFFEDNPADLVVEDDPNTGEKVVYFAQEPVLPRDWGLDVGQLVNNARTALDHLVYALAIEGGGNPEEAKTAFPIFEDRDEYWKVRGRGARKTTVRDQYLDGVDETWTPYSPTAMGTVRGSTRWPSCRRSRTGTSTRRSNRPVSPSKRHPTSASRWADA
jgi:hypothetical protein